MRLSIKDYVDEYGRDGNEFLDVRHILYISDELIGDDFGLDVHNDNEDDAY